MKNLEERLTRLEVRRIEAGKTISVMVSEAARDELQRCRLPCGRLDASKMAIGALRELMEARRAQRGCKL